MLLIENVNPDMSDQVTVPGATRIRKMLLPGCDCTLHPVASPERGDLEKYIAARFRAVYSAEISEFLPLLIGLKCRGRFSAAVGIRSGSPAPLFVEHYLDQRIEQVLSQRLEVTVDRADIAEIGNLVSNWRGASQLLFVFLVTALHKAGFKWVVFTATKEVERLIEKVGFGPIAICEADADRLGAERARWGGYYDTGPQVMAGDLDGAARHVRDNRLLALMYESCAGTIDSLASQLRERR